MRSPGPPQGRGTAAVRRPVDANRSRAGQGLRCPRHRALSRRKQLMALKLPIFMDNQSTTQVDPRVVETMLPFFTENYGNAASRNHVFGWTAEAAVENARAQVAALIGGDAKEIVWTSGATESNTLAIKGAASFYKKQGNHIITVETEHKCVLDTCKRLQREGYDVTYLRPQKDGLGTPQMVTDAMTDKTIIVSIMLANNEIGVVQDVTALD